MSDSEPEVKPVKKEKKVRVANEAQLEGLRKAHIVLKEKREKLAKEREEHEAKKAKGEVPADAPAPKFIPKPKVKVESEKLMDKRPVITRPRKERVKQVTANDLEAMKSSILSALAPQKVEVPVEKIVEKPVEKIVQKDRIVSGSDLLNAVFFSK
jgi:hypothetical protein